jgi:polyisoprenoid-binding protein YceI
MRLCRRKVLFVALTLIGCAAPPPRVTPAPMPAIAPSPTAAPSLVLHLVPGESRASYAVRERWLRDDVTVTVYAATQIVSGTIALDPLQPATAQLNGVRVNLFAIQSDDAERDQEVRYDYLQADTFPDARFVPKAINGLPESYVLGNELGFVIEGDLTVRDITRPVVFDISARFDGQKLSGVAKGGFKLTDFGITPPSKVGITVVEDYVVAELKFVAIP